MPGYVLYERFTRGRENWPVVLVIWRMNLKVNCSEGEKIEKEKNPKRFVIVMAWTRRCNPYLHTAVF